MAHYDKMKEFCPRRPSEYLASNVFIGASFLAPFEAQQAVGEGYAENVTWGRDFPHPEGTWKPTSDDETPMTRRQLRYAFSDIAPEYVKLMPGDNAIGACGLDGEVLAKVAERIGAPTFAELATPVDEIPSDPQAPAPGGGFLAFRRFGPWA
jgi:hypothetical protein